MNAQDLLHIAEDLSRSSNLSNDPLIRERCGNAAYNIRQLADAALDSIGDIDVYEWLKQRPYRTPRSPKQPEKPRLLIEDNIPIPDRSPASPFRDALDTLQVGQSVVTEGSGSVVRSRIAAWRNSSGSNADFVTRMIAENTYRVWRTK